ncbi:hypothetical protein C1X61_05150 [Pseudomonas sp. FW215-T2]|nr:hypothetical protein C1X61_05150 [Pseudomonas sp. FW215-T2]PNA14568.1 hypothetical protein C1X62_06530 [Pseudomonas sp. FW215-R3]PNB38546.1 hypothetical protein C1X63_06975 [Pseudomonas sp. FW305-131]
MASVSHWYCYNFEQLATGGRSQIYRTPQTPVGASLLAIAVDQSTVMLNLVPPSRASSLPQGEVVIWRCYAVGKLGASTAPRLR